jgi:maltose-binding protein MalE
MINDKQETDMKKSVIFLMTAVLAVMLAGCAATSIDTSGGRDGSSFEKAVIVGSVRAEYLYIDRTWKDANIGSQVVTENAGKTYDVVSITTKAGEAKNIYFDISSFYRKKTYADELE